MKGIQAMARATGTGASSKNNFAGMVSAWALRTPQRMHAVFRQSAQTLFNEVRKPKAKGGNMPIDTGNLRRSAVASNVEVPRMKPLGSVKGKEEYKDQSQNISAVVANTPLGGKVYLGFQASYAGIQEWRNGFVRLAAKRWKDIVAETARSIEAKVRGRSR